MMDLFVTVLKRTIRLWVPVLVIWPSLSFSSSVCPLFLDLSDSENELLEHRKKHLPTMRVLNFSEAERPHGGLPYALLSLVKNPYESLLILADAHFPLDLLHHYLSSYAKPERETVAQILGHRVRVVQLDQSDGDDLEIVKGELESFTVERFVQDQEANLSRIRQSMSESLDAYESSGVSDRQVEEFAANLQARYQRLLVPPEGVFSFVFTENLQPEEQMERWLSSLLRGVRFEGDDQIYIRAQNPQGLSQRVPLFVATEYAFEHPALSQFHGSVSSFFEWVENSSKLKPHLFQADLKKGIVFDLTALPVSGSLTLAIVGHESEEQSKKELEAFVIELTDQLDESPPR